MSSSVGAATNMLTARRRETVGKLVDAAVEEVRAVGFGGLTVRNVAARAGVAPATAYTYFDSKEHLVSEVFWRRLEALPPTQHDGRHSAATRVGEMLREVALLVADEPELSAACTIALLVDEPAVKRLRDRIGGNVHQRLVTALGEDDPEIVSTLELAWAGAMLQTGTGHLSYDELGDRLAAAARLILGGRR